MPSLVVARCLYASGAKHSLKKNVLNRTVARNDFSLAMKPSKLESKKWDKAPFKARR